MNKPVPILLTIPHPCTQNWDEMTPAQQGRFCAHCQKTVIDFSSWGDTALYNFFAKNTEPVCGRLLSSQLGRNINIPYQPHSHLYRLAIALGLTLMFTQTPDVLAQNRPPKTIQTTPTQHLDPTGSQTGELAGKILRDMTKPLGGARVILSRNHIIVERAISNSRGSYLLKSLDSGYYDITISNAGYEPVTALVHILPGNRTTLDFSLHKTDNRKMQVIATGSINAYFDDNWFFIQDKINHLPK